MGQGQTGKSSNEKTKKKEEENTSSIKIDVISEAMDYTNIFDEILNVSNELLFKYNRDFLKNDFCSKMAMIYEKKLSNFSIKLLRTINNEINDSNPDLTFTFQHLEKDDEKFVDVDEMFKDSLNDFFWNNTLEFKAPVIGKINNELNNSNINFPKDKNPYYVNVRHVNKLLSSNNNNVTRTPIVMTKEDNKKPMKGGKRNNNQIPHGNSFRKFLNSTTSKSGELRENKPQGFKQGNPQGFQQGKPQGFQQGKPQGFQQGKPQGYQGRNSEEEIPEEISEEIPEEIPEEIHEENPEEIPEEFHEENHEEIEEARNNNRQNNGLNNKNQLIQQLRSELLEKSLQSKKQEDSKKRKYNNTNMTENNTNINSVKKMVSKFSKKLNRNNENSEKSTTENEINKVVNQSITGENVNKNAVVNQFIKSFTVPRGYSKPSNFCNDTETCKLTKKELCVSISENFIVRNNIIAAILSTIPYKTDKGEYEGGICYQQFLNLDKCQVCVPKDYLKFKDPDIKYAISQILPKSVYLNEKECIDNDGYFLKLSKDETKILYDKKVENHYNNEFIQFIEKLKNTYFSSLKILLEILKKMLDQPIINNKTLNIIGTQTKDIIDEMYSLCNYYYVYAIIALINADVTIKKDSDEEIKKEEAKKRLLRAALA